MDIAVLGTGAVGRTLAGKLASLGHRVVLGTRDVAAAQDRADLAAWRAAHADVGLATFADAAGGAALVVNATSGRAALEALSLAGAERLAGKVVLDVSNPLDSSRGFPPRLWVCNDDSLGEQLQRAFPAARVVKSLNTVNADVMVDPGSIPTGQPAMFVCGDDPAARAEVAALLRDGLGWREVIDLGGIEAARGMEMALPLWLRLWGALGTARFALGVAR